MPKNILAFHQIELLVSAMKDVWIEKEAYREYLIGLGITETQLREAFRETKGSPDFQKQADEHFASFDGSLRRMAEMLAELDMQSESPSSGKPN